MSAACPARGDRAFLRRAGTLAAFCGVALIGLAPAAAAHVAVDSAAANGDGSTTVTLDWDHSCTPDSSTTGVEVSAGEGVEFTGASADPAGWTFTVEPERVSFTGPPIPSGERATVAVTARITATPGATVTFPSVQRCGEQQTAWTDADPSADHPAPSLVATAALASPAAAAPASGASVTEALVGVLALALGLGAAGFVAHRRADGAGP